MNILSIQECELEYQGNDGKIHSCTQTEFIIDDQPLSKVFDFFNNRPWFGRTLFEESSTEKAKEIKSLLGESSPSNQFGDNRQILYRCHCGCDYCGVVSCEIERAGDHVYWRDVRYQHDSGECDEVKFSELKFNYLDYEKCIKRAAKYTQ